MLPRMSSPAGCNLPLSLSHPLHSHSLALPALQVGNDRKAQAFLSGLDNDPVVGDVVDVTSHFEAEEVECKAKGVNLTPALWLLKVRPPLPSPPLHQNHHHIALARLT